MAFKSKGKGKFSKQLPKTNPNLKPGNKALKNRPTSARPGQNAGLTGRQQIKMAKLKYKAETANARGKTQRSIARTGVVGAAVTQGVNDNSNDTNKRFNDNMSALITGNTGGSISQSPNGGDTTGGGGYYDDFEIK